jgi:hypothetical protein
MRRLMALVTVALLVTAMLAVSATPALSITKPIDKPTPVIGGDGTSGGTPGEPAACELLAGGDSAGMFAWRPGGVCWVTPPA